MPLFRLLLIVALALGFGPRLFAGGESICGHPGAFAYDFEQAAPAAPEPERCDHCMLATALPPQAAPAPPGPRLAAGRAPAVAVAARRAPRPNLSARPRAPPLSA